MKPFFAIVFQISILSITSANSGAFVVQNGTDVTLGNSLFNITFCGNATAKSLFKNGVNLIDNIPKTMQTWYLDWDGEKSYFRPRACRIIGNSSEKAHVAFIQDGDADIGCLYIEFHLVVLPNVSGIYQYVKASNPTDKTISLGEFRTVHRFDHNLMPKVTNIVSSGPTPDLTDRPLIQDTTWQLKDGFYWSKYDFCGYIRETPWFGVYGGGFGGWIVSASREYHSSGPLKQELLVHHDSLMLNYFHSSHFGTPGLDAFPGWSKFYGPYLIYINTGSEDEVREDAAKQAVIEENQWPYSWVDDEEYPLSRGSVSGTVTGQPKAMVVVYDDIERRFDLQTLGYLYFSKTDENGAFTINNIRPGKYQIVAYPLAGQGSENLAQKNITVVAGDFHQDIGHLELPEPTGIIWSIGETNRRSDGFRYSNESRNFYWHLLPPSRTTFEIGKSRPSTDWYFAQPEGVWKIAYEDKPDNNTRTLRLAIAAATGSLIYNVSSVHLQVDVNNCNVANVEYENDKAIYRGSLQSGTFHCELMTVPADNVVEGRNEVTLKVVSGAVMYDAISLAR